ncbi:ParA family protein [Roseomonas nepalensis]|uniref:ParA family protein n=1 Tax=Muricoccus nepalensis TaxID=1854500 RepID=A0A502EXP3_9PROT|nr:ParA family protein [Roseomonas nepalensis]TPG41479.1 ParA family protein [Roseomonas nepalensis]
MKRILFSAGKGGVGKTTLCRNLAAAAARSGLKTVTADLDPQATLTIWSRRRPKTAPTIPHFKVSWIDADALLDDGEMEDYDALFIDTPPSIETQPAAFQALLARADLIIVPTRATFDDAESVAPFLKHLREEGRPSVAVLNFVKPRVNINAVKLFLLEAGELCPVEVADRTDYARAGAKGLGLVDVPGHAGADEMQAVWSFIRGKVWGREEKRRKKHVAAA